MNTNDFSYFIERYISNEMGADEKIWFEKELEGNPALENELRFRKKTESILKSSDIIDLRTKLRDIEKSRATTEVRSKFNYSRRVTYVATFTGLLLIGALIFMPGKNMSKDNIYKKYYKSYESITATRSITPVLSSLYTEAISYYNNHDYVKAAQALEKLLSSDAGNMEYRFQLANSYMGMQSYPEAGKSYLKVIEDNNNLFIEDAQWYLGLCYVMTNDNVKAKLQMAMIVNSDSRYKKEAKKLLKTIN